MGSTLLAGVLCLGVPLAVDAGPKPSAGSLTFYFPDRLDQLSHQENQALVAALTAAARARGKTMADPDAAEQAVAAVKRGISTDGTQCGAPVGYSRTQDAVAQRLGLCSAGGCSLRAAHWTVTCSVEWEGCSVSFSIPDGEAGAPASPRTAALFPEKQARSWKSVADLVKALGAARWRDVEERSPLVGGLLGRSFGPGGLGKPGALRERVPVAGGFDVKEYRRTTTPDVVWNLFATSPTTDVRVAFPDEAPLAACWGQGGPSKTVNVVMRRQPDGTAKITAAAEEPFKGCLEKVLTSRMAALKDVTSVQWTILRKHADVITTNGKYVVDVSVNRNTRDRGQMFPEPNVSDEVLASWEQPPATNWAQCMVDHPFTDAFAAGEKRSTLKLGVVVTFDVKGTATNAQITVPKGTSVSPAAQTCLINVAKQSRAPCSEQGGTAEATLTFSTYVVKNADAAPAK